MNAPSALETGTLVARADNKVVAEMGSQTVILDVESGEHFQLNMSAARIWDLLETPMTLAALCAKVEAAFDVDSETCRTEVCALLVSMHGKGLARIEAPLG